MARTLPPALPAGGQPKPDDFGRRPSAEEQQRFSERLTRVAEDICACFHEMDIDPDVIERIYVFVDDLVRQAGAPTSTIDADDPASPDFFDDPEPLTLASLAGILDEIADQVDDMADELAKQSTASTTVERRRQAIELTMAMAPTLSSTISRLLSVDAVLEAAEKIDLFLRRPDPPPPARSPAQPTVETPETVQ